MLTTIALPSIVGLLESDILGASLLTIFTRSRVLGYQYASSIDPGYL